MCRQKPEKDLLASSRKQLETLLFVTRNKIVINITGGVSLDQVLRAIKSLGRQLKNPPHYPMRAVVELAGKLEIPIFRAMRLWNFLEKENLIRYSCIFEAESQNKTILEISPGLSPAFA